MSRNFEKQRSRDRANSAAADNYALAAMLNEEFESGPSKAELREMADKACATARIRRLPTRVDVKCGKCGHTGRAFVRDGEPRRFKCSKCGAATR